MKIVIISESFSENMGYADSCLPKHLALLGHEVHVLASNTQVYYSEAFYNEVYLHFLGPPITAYGTKQFDGYTIHRLPFKSIKNGKMKLLGMFKKLAEIKPDIVQTFSIDEKTTFQAALYKPLLGYKLFTANHVVASVFPAAQTITEDVKKETQQNVVTNIKIEANKKIPSKFSLSYLKNGIRNRYSKFNSKNYFVNFITHICYPATIDASDIAIRFMGVPPAKIKINILGVDTEVFKPKGDNNDFIDEGKKLREKHGFTEQDIVCIYTGRFTEGKNPLCLARAIDLLVKHGKPYKALFIGLGPQKNEIIALKGCQVIPFMHYKELAQYYRAVDIGVWPKQESTSVLDATACGLPVIISDRVLAIERKEGNGLTYKENDSEDMKNVLLKLESQQYRNELGKLGIEKINKNQKWADIAKRRVQDYEEAISK